MNPFNCLKNMIVCVPFVQRLTQNRDIVCNLKKSHGRSASCSQNNGCITIYKVNQAKTLFFYPIILS